MSNISDGLTRNDAASFLKTNQGQELFALLKVGTSEDVAYRNFFEIITSGTNLPQKVTPETLYKITTAGKVGENTAYFATAGELEKLGKSGKTVADYFGLPGANEAPIYNLFEMQPKTPASAVFRSTIAPATDNVLLKQFNQPVHLNINRSGMGQQYIVPNRNEWGEPVFLRQIGN